MTAATTLTADDRIEAYARGSNFPPALWALNGVIHGIWIMGNDYRVRSGYYGGYPATCLRRVRSLFPKKTAVLHLFSGRVDLSEMPGDTVDINPELDPTFVDDAQTLKGVPVHDYDLILCDPPYSVEDAEHYKTTMVKRNLVMRALSERSKPGTHVVWLDQVLPMYRKSDWLVRGYIGVVKSTNHRFRVVTIFERREAGDDEG